MLWSYWLNAKLSHIIYVMCKYYFIRVSDYMLVFVMAFVNRFGRVYREEYGGRL